MKYSNSLIRLPSLLALIFVTGLGADAAVSNVLGVSKIDIKAGNVTVAPAYVHPQELGFSVESTSLSGDELQIDLSTASLTSGAFNESLVYPKYYVEVVSSGAYEGMVFDVVSNASDSVTILTWDDAPQPISAGTSVVVRKHMTLDDFFADATDQLLGGADSVRVFPPSGSSITIFWTGANWSTDFVENDGGLPIYPGQGFVTTFSSDISFNVIGEVKATPTQITIFPGANSINLIGSLSPIDESFDSLGSVGWLFPYADSLKLFAADGSVSTVGNYFSNGAVVTSDLANNPDDGDTVVVPHQSFLVSAAFKSNITLPPAYPAD